MKVGETSNKPQSPPPQCRQTLRLPQSASQWSAACHPSSLCLNHYTTSTLGNGIKESPAKATILLLHHEKDNVLQILVREFVLQLVEPTVKRAHSAYCFRLSSEHTSTSSLLTYTLSFLMSSFPATFCFLRIRIRSSNYAGHLMPLQQTRQFSVIPVIISTSSITNGQYLQMNFRITFSFDRHATCLLIRSWTG